MGHAVVVLNLQFRIDDAHSFVDFGHHKLTVFDQIGWPRYIQPGMSVDSSSFVEPAFELARIDSNGNVVLLTVTKGVGQVDAKSEISGVVVL